MECEIGKVNLPSVLVVWQLVTVVCSHASTKERIPGASISIIIYRQGVMARRGEGEVWRVALEEGEEQPFIPSLALS